MNVVVVESPAKAKTINRYLGSDFKVIASYGHVRDLPPKDGSVRPDDDFAMSWQVAGKSQKNIDEIMSALRGAKHLYLATDPDREGEAISWHVQQILDEKNVLDGISVQRVVFHEITKTAIVEAMKHPRELDESLIQAYLARRALDYLVGFTLSPVLWRKLPGSRSAGRVQSVCLRLICEREAEIEIFKADEYWSVERRKTRPSQHFGQKCRRCGAGGGARRRISGIFCRQPDCTTKSGAALHHLYIAAGSQPQARFQRQSNNAGRAAPL